MLSWAQGVAPAGMLPFGVGSVGRRGQATGTVSELIANRRVINLATLIQLKLAARRYQDFADVVNLIRVHNLDEAFLGQLHAFVHADYLECLAEKRREEEYESRQDQAFERMKR